MSDLNPFARALGYRGERVLLGEAEGWSISDAHVAPWEVAAYAAGAAVAFGLIGMAVAIDEGFAWCAPCQNWRLDCVCPYVPPAPRQSQDGGGT